LDQDLAIWTEEQEDNAVQYEMNWIIAFWAS